MDNLGKPEITEPHASLKAEVRELLLQVFDPEVGINIVDLGLVYEIRYLEEENTIMVIMTLTSRGCPMGPMITENVTDVLQSRFPEKDIHLHLVWEPAWSSEMISDQGRSDLGWG